MAGAGVTSNKAHNYFETPRIETAVPMAPFANNTTTTIAYSVGAGAELNLVPNVRFGGGYRYADFGSARLGTSPVQATQTPFRVGKVTSHQFLFQISVVA